MNEMQLRLLEILKWFHKLCIDNELRYYVIGGTFLGAVRHKGFIPWDDDIDVAMPRQDYNKLIRIYTKINVSEKYLLETIFSDKPDFLYRYAKLYDTTTTLSEKLRVRCTRGLFLDIFPLDGVGNTFEEAKSFYKKIDRLNTFLMMWICALDRKRSFYKNMAIILGRCIPSFLVDEKSLIRKVDKLASQKNFDSCEYVCNCFSPYRSREIMERRLLGKPTEYQFEDAIVLGPELYEEYLAHMFGNWRELPPIEDRKTTHAFTFLDMHKSWLNAK